jgi:ParB-like chromosome segregation protein Spo0J
MHIQKVKIKDILIGHRFRDVVDGTLDQITNSMRTEGQLQPIRVARVGNGLLLVFGNHRVHAARALGWDEIDAEIKTNTYETEELYRVALAIEEIDENMSRVELTGVGRDRHRDERATLEVRRATEEARIITEKAAKVEAAERSRLLKVEAEALARAEAAKTAEAKLQAMAEAGAAREAADKAEQERKNEVMKAIRLQKRAHERDTVSGQLGKGKEEVKAITAVAKAAGVQNEAIRRSIDNIATIGRDFAKLIDGTHYGMAPEIKAMKTFEEKFATEFAAWKAQVSNWIVTYGKKHAKGGPDAASSKYSVLAKARSAQERDAKSVDEKSTERGKYKVLNRELGTAINELEKVDAMLSRWPDIEANFKDVDKALRMLREAKARSQNGVDAL